MEETLGLRDLCVKEVRKVFADNAHAVAETDGCNFAAADIAVRDDDDYITYRITVVRQARRYSAETQV